MATRSLRPELPVIKTRGLQFTKNRRPNGRPIPIPAGANDLHFIIDRVRRVIVKAWWTKNGIPLSPPIRVPAGSNDFHLGLLAVGVVLPVIPRGLTFTKNGRPMGRPLPIPAGANDLHVVWNRLRRVIIAVWWTKNGLPLLPPVRVPAGANDLHLVL